MATLSNRELIAALQKFPADLPVYVSDWNELYAPPSELSESDLIVRDDVNETRDTMYPRALFIFDPMPGVRVTPPAAPRADCG